MMNFRWSGCLHVYRAGILCENLHPVGERKTNQDLEAINAPCRAVFITPLCIRKRKVLNKKWIQIHYDACLSMMKMKSAQYTYICPLQNDIIFYHFFHIFYLPWSFVPETFFPCLLHKKEGKHHHWEFEVARRSSEWVSKYLTEFSFNEGNCR